MKIAVIINAAAGSIAGQKTEDATAKIREAFHASNVAAEVKVLRGREIANAARVAAASGVDAVVAGGGDGTISTVAAALVGGSTPLGVLPLGTLTHFVFIGNNEYQINFLALGERSRINGGKLCLYVAKCRGRFCMFRLALLALINRLEQARDFDLRSLTEVWLETRKRILHVSLDG